MSAPPSGGGAGRRAQENIGKPEPSLPAPDPQAQVCAACGAAGSPPTIKTQNAGVTLTIGILHGKFAPCLCRLEAPDRPRPRSSAEGAMSIGNCANCKKTSI